MSDDRKKKLSIERFGSDNPAYGKPKTKKQLEATSRIWKGKTIPNEVKDKMSRTKKGKVFTDEHRKNLSIAFKGRVLSLEARHNMAIAHMGDKSSFWKGGLTKKSEDIRKSPEYSQWRREVFHRDNYKCVECGAGENIQADHIKPFSLFPELRFDINNGRTLCKSCHKETPTYGRKIANYRATIQA